MQTGLLTLLLTANLAGPVAGPQFVTEESYHIDGDQESFYLHPAKYHRINRAGGVVYTPETGEAEGEIEPLLGHGDGSKVDTDLFQSVPILPYSLTGGEGNLPDNRVYLIQDVVETVWTPFADYVNAFSNQYPGWGLEVKVQVDYMGSNDAAPAQLGVGFRGVSPEGVYDWVQGPDFPSESVSDYDLGGDGWTYFVVRNDAKDQALSYAQARPLDKGVPETAGFIGQPSDIKSIFKGSIRPGGEDKARIDTGIKDFTPGEPYETPGRFGGMLLPALVACGMIGVGVGLVYKEK